MKSKKDEDLEVKLTAIPVVGLITTLFMYGIMSSVMYVNIHAKLSQGYSRQEIEAGELRTCLCTKRKWFTDEENERRKKSFDRGMTEGIGCRVDGYDEEGRRCYRCPGSKPLSEYSIIGVPFRPIKEWAFSSYRPRDCCE